MPKAKITAETVEVLKQAEAAAGVPVLTPVENEMIQELVEPIIEAIDKKPEIPPDPKRLHIEELKELLADCYTQRLVLKGKQKNLDTKIKDVEKQYFDAIESYKTVYDENLQQLFPNFKP